MILDKIFPVMKNQAQNEKKFRSYNKYQAICDETTYNNSRYMHIYKYTCNITIASQKPNNNNNNYNNKLYNC